MWQLSVRVALDIFAAGVPFLALLVTRVIVTYPIANGSHAKSLPTILGMLRTSNGRWALVLALSVRALEFIKH